MNRQRRSLLAAGFALPWISSAPALAPPAARIEVMRFSALSAGGRLPDALQPWVFEDQPRHTRYSLVADDGAVVLRAQANASTSGLVRRIRVDLRTHPLLTWRWKPLSLVSRGNIARKDGDDFAVRVYVTFEVDLDKLPAGARLKLSLARMMYGDKLPLAALCYVWDARAPRGTIAPNAYTDRVQMIVAESGADRVGQWVRIERNVREDYLRAFGQAAGNVQLQSVPEVSAVIISTDTDNTGESVEAYYGDIEFRSLGNSGGAGGS